MATTAELVLDCRNTLGEGVVWCADRQLLFWVDIEEAELWQLDPASGQTRTWKLPERIGSFALREVGGMVVALASGFALFDPDSGEVRRVAEIEAHLDGTRLNDGRCDRQGRFFVGSMDDLHAQRKVGSLYRLDPDLSVHRLVDGVVCSNSICFSPDGRAFYFADSFQRRIWVYDYDIPSGIPRNRRIFADLRDQPGVPDGSTVDAEGCLWNAQWDGHRIVRYTPDGRVDRIIEMPVVRQTCVVFGGADLGTLYVTTARLWLSAEQLAAAPLSGGVFALRPGVKGLPEPKFAG